MKTTPPSREDAREDYSTLDVARLLGMAVRSMQLRVDRGELSAWKTPGGHRRISRDSVRQWLARRQDATLRRSPRPSHATVLLIVDILLPGIDGATLITSLRSHPQFGGTRLVVVTSLDEADREPCRFALQGVPVVRKTNLVAELPARLRGCLATRRRPERRRSAAMALPRVLMVEDDASLRRFFALALEDLPALRRLAHGVESEPVLIGDDGGGQRARGWAGR